MVRGLGVLRSFHETAHPINTQTPTATDQRIAKPVTEPMNSFSRASLSTWGGRLLQAGDLRSWSQATGIPTS
jgi:hypothetical protein